jgi:hypothetical protein
MSPKHNEQIMLSTPRDEPLILRMQWAGLRGWAVEVQAAAWCALQSQHVKAVRGAVRATRGDGCMQEEQAKATPRLLRGAEEKPAGDGGQF